MSLKPWVESLRNGPIQYQRGWTEFYKLKFKLTPDVLIPRPETELLVDEVLRVQSVEFRDRGAGDDSAIKIVEVGTGSGCIAVSIAKNTSNIKIFALDIFEDALKVAEENAKFHRVENKVLFLKSDLLSVLSNKLAGEKPNLEKPACRQADFSPAEPDRNDKKKSKIDIIVANLPYIPSARLMMIDPLVKDFEPVLALDGGQDGFELYRRMFAQMKERNLYPKYLIAEIDEEQGELARSEGRLYFPEAEIEIKKDLAKKDRILIVKFR